MNFRHVIVDASGPENPHVKAAGDLRGEGRAAVVVASSGGGPLVWYDYPDLRKHLIAPSGKWSCDAALADMNGDGSLDVVISQWHDAACIEWFENPGPAGDPGAGPWRCHHIGDHRAHDVEVGDLDGDGQLELATRNQNDDGDHIIVWKRTGPESWQHRVLPCPVGEGLALGDLNGDGRMELVIGGRWYANSGDILSDPWTEHFFAEWPVDAVVKLADMNADGRLDVILTRSEGHHRLSWFENPGAGVNGLWAEHVVDDDVDFAHGLVICDLGGDGRPDIVTAEMHQSPRKRVLVYANQGEDRWERQVLAETGSHNICVADVTGTGRLAIIGANWSGGYQPVELWLAE